MRALLRRIRQRYREPEDLHTWLLALWTGSLALSAAVLGKAAVTMLPAFLAMVDAGAWATPKALYFSLLLGLSAIAASIFGRTCQKKLLPTLDKKLGLA